MVKNFTLLALGALMLGGVAYAAPVEKPTMVKNRLSEAHKAHSLKANKQHVATRDLPTTDVITNPEGQAVIYTKAVTGYDAWSGGYFEDDNVAAQLVFGDNNKVYFQDPIFGWGMDSYVEGTIDGDKITLELPQTVANYGWYSINLCVCEYVDEEEYELVSDIDSVEYSYDAETGKIELNLPGEPEQYMLSYVYTDDESWTYSGEFTQVYTVFEGEVMNMPEGVETETYMLNDGYYGHPVNVAVDGDYLYLEGLSASMPKGVIRADFDGSVASIPQDQVTGTIYGYFIYSKVLNEKGTSFVDGDYVLNVDLENKVIESADPSVIFALNAMLDQVYAFEVFQDFSLEVQDSYAGTPENPYNLQYDDSYAVYGMSIFAFNIPNFSTSGKVLLADDLYYRVYVDGELFEFEYDSDDETYPDVEGEMTDVPFTFDNGYDLYWYDQVMRVVMFYFEGATTFGVQSVYKYDGVETTSDIMTLNIETGEVTTEPAGVESIYDASVVNSVYYDLSGRKVMNPSNGIFIQRNVMSDGQIVTKKVIKR